MKVGNIFYMTVLLVVVIINMGLTLWMLYKEERIRKNDAHDPETKITDQLSAMFSNREKEIALAILEGKTNCEIAQEKCISPTTVKKHVYNLFQKTKARNRVEFINFLRNEDRINCINQMNAVPTASKH